MSKGPDCDDTDPEKKTGGDCFELDDPCANKDLRNKKVSDEVKSKINGRIQNIADVPGEGPPLLSANEFGIQDLETAGTGKINVDLYELDITKLPNGITGQQLFEDIRKNFGDLVTGGDFFWEETKFRPYEPQDNTSWSSSNPLGSAMDFQTPFDTATVIATEYSVEEMFWTFTTVTSFDHWGHPVSGHRQFRLRDNADGSFTFEIRGADRLHSGFDSLANDYLPSPGGGDFAFDLADRTWKNLMKAIEDYVKSKPGSQVEPFDKSKEYATRHNYNPNDCK